MDVNLLNKICKEIRDTYFYRASRAGDMMCLELGDEVLYESLRKDKKCKLVGQYTFHIQCPWRIRNQEILLASKDIFIPGSKVDFKKFDWEVLGMSKFDEMSIILNNSWKHSFRIKDIQVSQIGDLKIIFENGIIFETFIDNTEKDEEWRLINYKTGNHYISVEEIDYSLKK